MILNTNEDTKLIRLQIASTDKLEVDNDEIKASKKIIASTGEGEGITIYGSGAANANLSFISFRDSDGTDRYGYCGIGSSSDQECI